MALTKERIGEIAMVILQYKLEQDGELCLNPKEVKRDVTNNSRKLGIPVHESAEFAKIVIKAAYEKTIAELDTIKPEGEKQSPKTDKVEKQ